MKKSTRLGLVAGVAAAAIAGSVTTASAATQSADRHDSGHAVFVQTDGPAGNQVIAYHRDSHGALTQTGAYWTGGVGGVLTGSVVDHLASQGSLTYDARHELLYVVNAGSNTVSVFSVEGDRLTLRQVVSSGGTFPVSIAVSGNLVYVLNALGGGSVQGFVNADGTLVPVSWWHRSLGLDPTATPQFTHTPGQIGFAADGTRLVVTTKANGNNIDVFKIDGFGGPSATPVVNSEPGTVPFAFVSDGRDRLIVAEAGTNSVVQFKVNADGTLTWLASAATGQAATCWIASAGSDVYASNAGSGTVSGYWTGHAGLTALGNTATDAGTVDASGTPDGRFLYVQTGKAGIVDGFRVNSDGSLTAVGSQIVPGAIGAEGIVAI